MYCLAPCFAAVALFPPRPRLPGVRGTRGQAGLWAAVVALIGRAQGLKGLRTGGVATTKVEIMPLSTAGASTRVGQTGFGKAT